MTRIRSDEFPIVGLLSAFLPRILRFYISELDSEVWQAFVEAHWIASRHEIALYKYNSDSQFSDQEMRVKSIHWISSCTKRVLNPWVALTFWDIFGVRDSPSSIACQRRTIWSFYKIPKGGGRREVLVCYMSWILSFWRTGTDWETDKALFFPGVQKMACIRPIGPYGTFHIELLKTT